MRASVGVVRGTTEGINLVAFSYGRKFIGEGDEILVSQMDAEEMCRRMAREEGLFAGVSAAGACWVAQEIAKTVTQAVIVFIVCDRGDRYLSTGIFPA